MVNIFGPKKGRNFEKYGESPILILYVIDFVVSDSTYKGDY
jgi:hypothetical protein